MTSLKQVITPLVVLWKGSQVLHIFIWQKNKVTKVGIVYKLGFLPINDKSDPMHTPRTSPQPQTLSLATDPLLSHRPSPQPRPFPHPPDPLFSFICLLLHTLPEDKYTKWKLQYFFLQ